MTQVFSAGSPHSIVANLLDGNIVVSKFKFQSCYYIPFWTNALGKSMKLLIPFRLLSFYKNDFGIKTPMKVDMPLNK